MRFGLFSTYENPQQDYASAYREQTELVRLVEGFGFSEAWVAEHHFNPGATSPSCLALLAYLAGQTSRIRLGSAAVLLPFHNPITVAEDVATVDILSGGRFDFGVAKGGPFPIQNKHFGVRPDEARARAFEALDLVEKLLTQTEVTFKGAFYSVEGLELVPKPIQSPIPTFIGTSTADAVRVAAQHGYGLMAAPPFPLAAALDNARVYREAAPGADPRFTLIRFFHLAPTRAQAEEEARAFLAPFVERMQATTAKVQPDWTPWFTLERMIGDSLIGTQEDVMTRMEAMERDLGLRTLVLKPLSPSFAKRKSDLATFAQAIQPHFAAMA